MTLAEMEQELDSVTDKIQRLRIQGSMVPMKLLRSRMQLELMIAQEELAARLGRRCPHCNKKLSNY